MGGEADKSNQRKTKNKLGAWKDKVTGKDAEEQAKILQANEDKMVKKQQQQERLRLAESESEINKRKIAGRMGGGKQSLITGQTPQGSLLGG